MEILFATLLFYIFSNNLFNLMTAFAQVYEHASIQFEGKLLPVPEYSNSV